MSWLSFSLEPMGPPWLEWSVGLLLVLLWGLSFYSTRGQVLTLRLPIAALRLLILAGAFFLLHQPTLVRQVSRKPERTIAVLLDRSGSMWVKDEEMKSRFAAAGEVLEHLRLQEPNLRLFEFDSELYGPLVEPSSGGELTGKLTDFHKALGALLALPESFAGIVILSDGHDLGRLSGMDLEQARAWLQRQAAPPIHAFALGQVQQGPEIAIHSLEGPAFSWVRAPLNLQASIFVRHLDQTPRQVQLLEGQKVLQVRELQTDEQGFGKVSFEIYPETLGTHLYTVHIPPHSSELNPLNNSRNHVVEIGRDRISVLHIAGSVTWDLQALRGLFERNSQTDLTAFYIMRTREHAQVGTDGRPISPDEMALVPFPTEEIFDRQLFAFDVIVFQDFDAGNYFNDSYQARRLLAKIRTFVEEHHGGLIVIGGPQTAAGPSLGATPLAEALALIPPQFRAPYLGQSHQLQFTRLGKNHPLLAQLDPQNIRLVGAMDRLKLHPQAELLLQTPQGIPLLATLSRGSGRSLFLNTSSSWHWYRDELAEGRTGGTYTQFWDALLRWTINDPSLNQVRLQTFRSSERPLELDVEVLLRDKSYRPAAGVLAHLRLSPMNENSGPVEGALQTDDQGVARVRLQVHEPGYYRLELIEEPWKGMSQPALVFLGGAQEEFGNQDPVRESLARLAALTGGALHDRPDFDVTTWKFRDPPHEEILETDRLKLRNWVWGLPLLLLLASLEWALRRTRFLA